VAIATYRLGCAIWSNPDWRGEFYTVDAQSSDFLRQYTTVFNTVEGNTTFYGLPRREAVARWKEEAAADFRFCFKFPRSISHERRLRGVAAETREFLERLMPLTGRLGPLFLQMPKEFGPADLETLAHYLTQLPADLHYALEVRHADFFSEGTARKHLDRLLRDFAVDRVVLDSRALFTARPDDPETREAQRRKPRLPVLASAIGRRPVIRFIGHPELAANRPFLVQWAERVAEWLTEGRTPYVFLHTPNNRHAPSLARLFHSLLKERLAVVGELPDWPAEKAIRPQLTLF
jgi:uncharacterized protein YecE (DUF72 family)